jgi:hypothetical protein
MSCVKQEVLGRINHLFSLIRYGPHRKRPVLTILSLLRTYTLSRLFLPSRCVAVIRDTDMETQIDVKDSWSTPLPFQIGIDWSSHLRKVPRRRWISHTYPVWLWARSLFKISLPGPGLHGTKRQLWRPYIRSPTLHSRSGINEGLIKRGSTTDHWRSRCNGWILRPTPYAYIYTYIKYAVEMGSGVISLIMTGLDIRKLIRGDR